MKKAQIDMMETVIVLVLVFFVLILGFAFFASRQRMANQGSLDQSAIFDQVVRTSEVSLMAEIGCSSEGVVLQNCFDRLRLDSFRQRSAASQEYYAAGLGYATITVNEYKGGSWESYTIYDRQKPDYQSVKHITIGGTIYDPLTKKNNPGGIDLDVYN